MGDVAQILGVSNTTKSSNTPPDPSASHSIPRSIQNVSTVLNKPVLKMLSGKMEAQNHTSSSTLPPIVPSHNLPLQTIKRNVKVNDNNSNNNRNNHSTTTPLPSSSSSSLTLPKQPTLVKINNKFISSGKKARSWIYAPFANSARKDGLLLHHWVRAGVEYPEYPYARFDIHLDELSYRSEALELQKINATAASTSTLDTKSKSNNNDGSKNNTTQKSEEEIHTASSDSFYQKYLQNDKWTQSETDTLLELCRTYELRWPVIIDRWIGKYGSLSSKKVEDLQHRYYTIGYIINRIRVERAAKIEAETLAKAMAIANQNIPHSVSSSTLTGMSISKPVMAGTTTTTATTGIKGNTVPGGSNLTNVAQHTNIIHDSNSKEEKIIQAEHALVSAIASSSSTAVDTLLGAGVVQTNLQPPIPATNTGTSNQPLFDLDAERQRRKVLDIIWARTKEEELEEIELRNELKLVETQIRKLKKSGSHILAAAVAAAVSVNNDETAAKNDIEGASQIDNMAIDASFSRGVSPIPTTNNSDIISSSAAMSLQNGIINAPFASTAPTPTPGTPYLQSGRQKQPSTGGQMGINKTTLKNMDQILSELNIPVSSTTTDPFNDKPCPLLPTKRVCDVYDHVRKNALMLLTLQKIMLKKENEVLNKRMKLEKMAGGIVQQQEAAKAAAAAAAAAAAKAKAAADKIANSKSSKAPSSKGSGGGSGSNKNNNSSSITTTSGTPKKGTSKSASGKSSAGAGVKAASKEGSTKKKKKPSSSTGSEGGATKKRKTATKKKDSKTSTTKNKVSSSNKSGVVSTTKSTTPKVTTTSTPAAVAATTLSTSASTLAPAPSTLPITPAGVKSNKSNNDGVLAKSIASPLVSSGSTGKDSSTGTGSPAKKRVKKSTT